MYGFLKKFTFPLKNIKVPIYIHIVNIDIHNFSTFFEPQLIAFIHLSTYTTTSAI